MKIRLQILLYQKKVKPLPWDIFTMKFYSEILTLVFGITRLMIMRQASLLKLILEGIGPDMGLCWTAKVKILFMGLNYSQTEVL